MRRRYIYHILLALSVVIISGTAKAQQGECSGSLGDPVLTFDFGRGLSPNGPAIPDKTNYNYVVGQPQDGSYTIVKSTQGMGHVNAGSWLLVNNRTQGQSDGYMMLVNANDQQAGIFFQQTITGLCPGTTYEFAAWIINVMARPGIKPNIKFTIESTSGGLLKEFDTGDIPEGARTDWKRYAGTFRTTNDRIVVKIRNNGLGGGGNDFALDDITFRACGPVMIPFINTEAVSTKEHCVLLKKDFTFSADVSTGVYVNPQYLWQYLAPNGTWTDLPGETNTSYTETFDNRPIGEYKYRLLTSESGNINSENCRSYSPEYTINVVNPPDPVALKKIRLCDGETLILQAITKGEVYKWTGPNAFSSAEKSPNIPAAKTSMSGKYTVLVTTSGGCVETEEIVVSIEPRPNISIASVLPICRGSSVQLQASGGLMYRWSPATGLTETDQANPIVTPLETTTYTVYGSNGACEVSSDITVIVLQDPLAAAGSDKKIMKGQSIQLNGQATGDGIAYKWMPESYLDDPTKLNPIATPISDITYTLIATSVNGCATSSDEVFIRVYQEVEVPSAFSPNGDGVNDVWKITAADMFPTASVKVLNRYGEIVFKSNNYDLAPWDGKYRNKDLPAGVYYYIINLDTELKPLSGSLTVIR